MLEAHTVRVWGCEGSEEENVSHALCRMLQKKKNRGGASRSPLMAKGGEKYQSQIPISHARSRKCQRERRALPLKCDLTEDDIVKVRQALPHVIKPSFPHTAIFLLDPESLRLTLKREMNCLATSAWHTSDFLPPHELLTFCWERCEEGSERQQLWLPLSQ